MEFGTREFWPDGTNVEKQSNLTSERTFLRDLSPGSTNKVLVGVVISKLSVHSFPDKKNPGSERYSLGFTIRDSPMDYVNVTCWGNGPFINDIAKSFKINDVVEIRNPQVSPKQASDYEQQWKPWTPSNVQLNVSETHSTVSLYSGWDLNDMNVLLHTPVKENGDYCVIDDILTSGQNLHGDHLNVLVAVKHVATPKDIMTKRGKQVQKCDVQVFDETCHSFPMLIWDENIIEMAVSWIPGETVLFIADLKIVYDDYKNAMSSVCDNRTIITVNPDTRQAHQLYSYAQTPEILNGLTMENNGGGKGFNLDGITDVYTIQQMKQCITKAGEDNGRPSDDITGIVFAFLTKFNIDDNTDNILTMRW
ncbi:meiosis-specific with OB domain-containing protein-like [Dendronephthya gigantea]|uniref:meiosis-specific with OB domain-containing protein-like n=1 Tax=Dendronephthya gigantea TaxID=151771 RepID=UPI00106B1B77|nr:meiosis-specific with OB domain-containing protein-like [Dendronephthya gigantea]